MGLKEAARGGGEHIPKASPILEVEARYFNRRRKAGVRLMTGRIYARRAKAKLVNTLGLL